MTAVLHLYDGSTAVLPVLTEWQLDYTTGVPADAFRLRFPVGSESLEILGKAVTFTGTEDGETVFTGAVAETVLTWDGDGAAAEITGRGMAARLLDNEAQAQDYTALTTALLLRDHVTPYGITTADAGNLSAVTDFSVSSGSSEWSVLYEFARYYNGVTPWFDRLGQLHLAEYESETALLLDEGVPLTALEYRETRYGVLSSVIVQAKNQLYSAEVTNDEFLAQGGCARQVITMPTNASYQALRYSGQYQLDESGAERYRLTADIAVPFWGQPGDRVTVNLPQAGLSGAWKILTCSVRFDADGARSVVTMGEA